MSNEDILRIRVNNNLCGDFYVTMKEDNTMKELISAIREGFNARGTQIDKFCGPVDVPLNLSLKEMKLETVKFDLMTLTKYKISKRVSEAKEYVDTKSKHKKLAKPVESIETRLKTGKHMRCHICGERKQSVYLCPRNEFHRFCHECIQNEGVMNMEKGNGCDICLGKCECDACKK